MLYSIFLFNSNSGELIWKKALKRMLRFGNNDCFCLFYYYIRNYSKLSTKSEKYLLALMKYLKFKKISVEFRYLSNLDMDMVIFSDYGDEQIINEYFLPYIKSKCQFKMNITEQDMINQFVLNNFNEIIIQSIQSHIL